MRDNSRSSPNFGRAPVVETDYEVQTHGIEEESAGFVKPITSRGNLAQMGTMKRERGAGFEKAFEQIYRIVLRIPRGRVMTYGQIARLLDERYSPRLVGWAMHATPKDARNIPWHRVINSRGGISTGRVILEVADLQRLLLEGEGVAFDERGRCDLARYQWSPSSMRGRAALSLKKSASDRRSATKKKQEMRKR